MEFFYLSLLFVLFYKKTEQEDIFATRRSLYFLCENLSNYFHFISTVTRVVFSPIFYYSIINLTTNVSLSSVLSRFMQLHHI